MFDRQNIIAILVKLALFAAGVVAMVFYARWAGTQATLGGTVFNP